MNRKKLLLYAGLPLVLVLGTAGAVVGYYAHLLRGQAPTSERLFRTSTGGKPHYEPIQYRAKDSRPAITEPQFVSADEAKMAAGTRGIGVSVNGDARFYPLFIMQYHQVVNDRAGDKPVACSYWPSEHKLMVHERRIEETGEEVTLRVSGQVRLGNLIMFDTKTGSHWLQETGESIEGEREGQGLRKMKPEEWIENVRWDEWKKQHPNAKVLVCDHCEKAGR